MQGRVFEVYLLLAIIPKSFEDSWRYIRLGYGS